jgi:ssDNA-binding replication factor A large subunit
MYDFEALVSELLQTRPGLGREELLRRIQEKKKTVGAGYLTDQGALFLVAGELGVSLRKEEASADLRIGDMYIGANDVTVVARVLAVYPVATFNRKDGGSGKYMRLVLFDGRQTARLTVWEEGVEQVQKLAPKVGAVVRVANGYVKQGLDGKPTLNLGKRGRMEMVTDEKISSRLQPLSAATGGIPKLSKEESFVALECTVTSEPRYSEFVRSDGSQGSLFQFGARGEGGGETRVVIWSPSARPELKKGQKVTITNVKARRSSNGEYEIHGDGGSVVQSGMEAQKAEFRVAAVTEFRSVKVALVLGNDKRIVTLELSDGVRKPSPGEVVEVASEEGPGGMIRCRTPDSLKVVEGDTFPSLEALATKLQEAREGAQIMVEVIALSHGTADDIRLRDGTTVKKGELVVGDDTGELKLVGWRELSERVSGIQPGERLRIVGVAPKSTKMGAVVLELTNYSSVERIRGLS